MNYYLSTGKDETSDEGYWVYICQTSSQDNATLLTKLHLKQKGREDLIDAGFKTKLIQTQLTIYSTVQNG